MPRLGGASGPEASGGRSREKSRRASEQDRPEPTAERAAWRDEFAGVDPARPVFIDETGASTAMDRTHGRAPGGVRVGGPAPHGRWKVVALAEAVRPGGVGALDGATDSAAFETYVERRPAPTPRPGDVVILDDWPCRKTAEAARPIAAAGAEPRFLPPYGPDLNPIERMSSKLKAWLR
ncbi:transposase [Planctomyces sp. SH-PL62]|uniref:transposase n=1 Tax=Planctomyces sp. SH-PL62 TaxID=1636152 RepID=UPI000838EF03|nr:transposase [Planctomyces sp. SH-PL62]